MTHNRMIEFYPGTEFPNSSSPVLAKTSDGLQVLERYDHKWYNSDEEVPYRVEDSDVLFWAYLSELP